MTPNFPIHFFKIHRLTNGQENWPEPELPAYATPGSYGVDLKTLHGATIGAGETVMLPTGLGIILPEKVEFQIRSRSGLSAKKSLVVTNAPATIDHDYRGELMILLTNIGRMTQEVLAGERVAQGVFTPVLIANVRWGQPPEEKTSRGNGGFGSTGSL